MVDFSKIKDYFRGRLKQYGATPLGLDWNSSDSQNTRYDQLLKIIDPAQSYTIIDYGCGFGSLYDYLKEKGHAFQYQGYDIVPEMVEEGRRLHKDEKNCVFTSEESELLPADYVVESGIFNMKQNDDRDEWEKYVLDTLNRMNQLAVKGLAGNFLTKYSDADHMRADLYYADPCLYFDYCKRNYSKNVALLHDYELYDFTILVRKSANGR